MSKLPRKLEAEWNAQWKACPVKVLSGAFLAVWLTAVPTRAATLELGDTQQITATQSQLGVRLAGSSDVVALQFDVSYPAALAAFTSPSLATLAAQKHQMTLRELQPGLLRVVIYSASNAALPQDLLMDLPMSRLTGSPEEGPTLTIYNIWFADAAGRMIPASARYGPIARWKRLSFTPQELSNAAVSGDLSDPESDGLPNLVEMLLRGRAKVSDPGRLPVLGMTVSPQDGQQYLTLTYRRWRGAQGIEALVQASTDMQTWPTIVPTAPTGVEDAETIEMQARVLIQGQGQMFLRLRAQRKVTQ